LARGQWGARKKKKIPTGRHEGDEGHEVLGDVIFHFHVSHRLHVFLFRLTGLKENLPLAGVFASFTVSPHPPACTQFLTG
jgi:hypothetical protein